MGLIIGSQQGTSPSAGGSVRYDRPQSLTASQKETAQMNIGVQKIADFIINDLISGGASKVLSAEMGKYLKQLIDTLSLGKFYGFFATASDLPSGSEIGYAYVGSENPYSIYNFNGTWSDSGTTINNAIEIINNLVTNDPTSALSAAMGRVLSMLTNSNMEDIEELMNLIKGTGGGDIPLSGTWRQGTLNDAHVYTANNSARVIMTVPYEGLVKYRVRSGYYVSIHSYSTIINEATQISSGSSWLGNIRTWTDGEGSIGTPANGKTFVFILKKGDAGTESISPSEAVDALDIWYTIQGQGGIIKRLDDIAPLQFPTITWRQGSINNAHIWGANNARIISALPYSGDISIDVAEGYYISVHSFSVIYNDINEDTQGTGYIGSITGDWKNGTVNLSHLEGGKTYAIIVKKGEAGTANISPSEGLTAVKIGHNPESLQEQIVGVRRDVDTLWGDMYGKGGEIVTDTLLLEQGGIEYNGTLLNDDTIKQRRIRSLAYETRGAFTLAITGDVAFNLYFYNSEGQFVSRISESWVTNLSYTGSHSGLIRVLMRDRTDATSPITIDDAVVTVTQGAYIPGVKDLIRDTGNYVYGCDLIKRHVKLSQIGSLTYQQAFCKYDGKYYSTDGSHIAEQSSNFSVLRNVSINLGHGNSLQLVSGGKAWASGWNDNKMYKVNLSTLTVEQTVTLPTTGYTTAAVDEANGLMYIFQRDSYPDTIAPYNFIVYDYLNDEIKSEKVVESFGAMQSADYYQGKILMVYGFGTQAIPSGMRIYDTNGNVLSFFDLTEISNNEYEGVQFDRDTLELLISVYNKSIYKITNTI